MESEKRVFNLDEFVFLFLMFNNWCGWAQTKETAY